MATTYRIIKDHTEGIAKSTCDVLITDAEVLQALADLQLDYITLKSATKLWKLTVDDTGTLTTTEIL